MANKPTQEDREKSVMLEFYRRYNKTQLDAIYEMMKPGLDKMVIAWENVMINSRKTYCDTYRMKLEVLLELINE